MKTITLIIAISLWAATSQAATVCVGSSATGDGSGADWNNMAAWSSISFVRGDTYLIKGGSTYNARTLNTAVSGTTPIYILGATTANAGSIPGWSNSYSVDKSEGGSQASFGYSFSITTSYWVWDGTAGPKFSSDPTAYGFYVNTSAYGGSSELDGILVGNMSNQTITDITLAHFSAIAPSQNITKECIALGPGSTGGIVNNFTASNFYVSGWEGFVMTANGGSAISGMIVQYGMFMNHWASSAHHGEWINANSREITNDIIRWNHFENYTAGTTNFTSNIVANNSKHTYCQIYGNVFYNTLTTNDLIGDTSVAPMQNCQIYNNTFVSNTVAMNVAIGGQRGDSTGNTVYNNLFYNQANASVISWTRDYNAYFSSGSGNGETHKQVGSGSPFVSNYITSDSFQLSSHTMSGMNTNSLLPGNNVDANGVTRGIDGVWDIGAYQFTTGIALSKPMPPVGLLVN
jgi:hypothetical protein